MSKLPDYIGPVAFGIKMGVIVPGADLVGMIASSLDRVFADHLCIESIHNLP